MGKYESSVPAAIRSKREAFGLTQAQAAALIFVALRTWQDWEAGRRQMPACAWELFNLKLKSMP